MFQHRQLSALALAVVMLLGAACAPAKPALPVVGEVPEFHLTSGDGRPFTRADLEGSVWIVDFIFTRCSGVCPMMTARMAGLQKTLAAEEGAGRAPHGGVRLLSISVDPDYDTAAVLTAYAKQNGADPARWVFLTGAEQEVFDLSQKGFLLAAGRDDAAAAQLGGPALTHSEKFVLVDRRARVRAYYDSGETGALQQLADDAIGLSRDAS